MIDGDHDELAAPAAANHPQGVHAGVRPTVSILICAYTIDRWRTLQASVAAVVGQLNETDELILVIDYCEPLLDRARAEWPKLRILANEEVRGLSGARNSGVKAAAGDVIVFLDDDAVPESDWLELLVDVYRDPIVLGVGGQAEPYWETERPGWFPSEFLWVVGCSYDGLPGEGANIRNPIGANMSFRRSVFSDVGHFAYSLGRTGQAPTGCEETELSIRVARSFPESRIVHQPRARVNHHVTAERTSVRYFRRRCWSEGISKALVTRLAGPDAALSTEREYATRVLPRGFVKGLRDGAKGDAGGLGRSVAIGSGAVITAAGYLTGLMRYRAID